MKVFLPILIPMGLLCAAGLAEEGKRWWSHVQFLADDRLQGRETGSEGHRTAAGYVARQFQEAGLRPAGTDRYLQPVKFQSRRIREERSSLELLREGKPERLELGEDAYISLRSDPVEFLEAPAVFVGYGLTVPEKGHLDLAGLDLRGSIAVMVSGSPDGIPGPLASHYQSSSERWKFLKRAGAVGVATIANPKTSEIPWDRSKLARLLPAMGLTDPALAPTPGLKLSIVLNPARADKFLAGTPHRIADLLALAAQGKPLPRFPLAVAVRARVAVDRENLESHNVAGILPGSDPKLKDETIIVSAHLDHVGVGEPVAGDRIHNGAMDNASGIASLIETARRLRESGRAPRRSILFLAVTGEEKGLLGSNYFAANPTVNAAGIVANLNLDMFLPLHALRSLIAFGSGESSLGADLAAVAREFGVTVQEDPEPARNRFIRSDQYNFIRRGVPALAFKFGYSPGSPEEKLHKDWTRNRYHAPSDDLAQPVDLEAAAQFNRLFTALLLRVANAEQRPRWNQDSFFRRFAAGS